MLINIDQTPLKYALVPNQTMVQKGSKHVAIEGSPYKNAITATFGITYDDQFFELAKAFLLSANEKYFSTPQSLLSF